MLQIDKGNKMELIIQWNVEYRHEYTISNVLDINEHRFKIKCNDYSWYTKVTSRI